MFYNNFYGIIFAFVFLSFDILSYPFLPYYPFMFLFRYIILYIYFLLSLAIFLSYCHKYSFCLISRKEKNLIVIHFFHLNQNFSLVYGIIINKPINENIYIIIQSHIINNFISINIFITFFNQLINMPFSTLTICII